MAFASNLALLDTAHTGGREVPSDIVLPDSMLERAFVVISGAALDAADLEPYDDAGFAELEDADGEGSL